MGIAVPVTRSEAALARKIVIPAKSSGKPQFVAGHLETRSHVLNCENSQFPIQTTPVSREMSLSRICRFSLLYHQKRNFNARFSPEAKTLISR
jgi:hypothetical protein